jgi:hypothetical protein
MMHHEVYNEQDANLKRCFGKPEKLIDCEWDYIRSLKTIAEPHVSMPRLKDLLEYLATPGLEHIWVLLDIKVFLQVDSLRTTKLTALPLARQ